MSSRWCDKIGARKVNWPPLKNVNETYHHSFSFRCFQLSGVFNQVSKNKKMNDNENDIFVISRRFQEIQDFGFHCHKSHCQHCKAYKFWVKNILNRIKDNVYQNSEAKPVPEVSFLMTFIKIKSDLGFPNFHKLWWNNLSNEFTRKVVSKSSFCSR